MERGRVFGIVADVEIDAGIVRDQHRIAAYRQVAQRHRRNHQNRSQQKNPGPTNTLTLVPPDPRRCGQYEEQHGGHGDGRHPENNPGSQKGFARGTLQSPYQQRQSRQVQKRGQRDRQQFPLKKDRRPVQRRGQRCHQTDDGTKEFATELVNQ